MKESFIISNERMDEIENKVDNIKKEIDSLKSEALQVFEKLFQSSNVHPQKKISVNNEGERFQRELHYLPDEIDDVKIKTIHYQKYDLYKICRNWKILFHIKRKIRL